MSDGPLSFDDEQPRAQREPPPAAPERPGDRPPRRREPPRSARPPGASRYGWIVALAALVAVALITLNQLSSGGPGSRGVPVGRRLPPFAAPLAMRPLQGDVNVATRRDEGSAGKVPACDVTEPGALNICRVAARGPVVLAFLVAGDSTCVRQLDAIQRLMGRFPGVGFVAVAERGDRDTLRATIRRHGWTFPIGYDRDGALAGLYGLAGCYVEFAYRGRTVMRTTLQFRSERALEAQVRALVAGQRRRS